MMYQKIELEFTDKIAHIRLNDPKVLNAVSLQMADELKQALVEAESKARVLVLTGNGRAFCAGASLAGDVGLLDDDGGMDAGAVLETTINPLMSHLRNLSIPWISAVRGAAAGVGCSFALAADLIVASEEAYFLQAFSRIGLVPDGGSSWLLSRGVSRVRALEMMLLGERISAPKALEWGLINRVTTEESLDEAALEIADTLANGATKALGMIRKLAWAAADASWDDALAMERQFQRLAGDTADHAEGVAAFRAKRPAQFTGN